MESILTDLVLVLTIPPCQRIPYPLVDWGIAKWGYFYAADLCRESETGILTSVCKSVRVFVVPLLRPMPLGRGSQNVLSALDIHDFAPLFDPNRILSIRLFGLDAAQHANQARAYVGHFLRGQEKRSSVGGGEQHQRAIHSGGTAGSRSLSD